MVVKNSLSKDPFVRVPDSEQLVWDNNLITSPWGVTDLDKLHAHRVDVIFLLWYDPLTEKYFKSNPKFAGVRLVRKYRMLGEDIDKTINTVARSTVRELKKGNKVAVCCARGRDISFAVAKASLTLDKHSFERAAPMQKIRPKKPRLQRRRVK